ncbi:MAG: hypothetical protein DWQ06_05035 [Calditrichaeota bacterium]|nr:MAG: hypothetical protein DWQ06_05035 [Calditrichota bacterium]
MDRLSRVDGNQSIQPMHIFLVVVLLSVVFGLLFIILKFDTTIVIAVAIGIAIVVFSFVEPKYAIFILIFSMLLSPEYGQRSTEGSGATLRLEDFFLSIITFIWFLKMALKKDLGLILKTNLNGPIFIYIAMCCLSTLWGMIGGRVNPTTGTLHVIKYLQYYVMFFMIINNIDSKQTLRQFMTVMFITAFIVAIVALAQIPGGERISAPFEGSEGGEPNTLGGYLTLMLGPAIALFLFSPNALFRAIFAGLSGLLMIPLLYSQSRSSWVAFGVMYLVMLIVSTRRSVLFVGLIAGIVILPLIAPSSVIDRFQYTFSGQEETLDVERAQLGELTLDASTSERFDAWKRVWNDLPKHPFIGFGITGWKFLDAQYAKVIIETGVFGLIFFLYLKFVVLKNLWSVYRRDDYEDWIFRGLSLGAFCATFGMLAHAFGANTFIIVRIMEPFWLLVGMVMMVPEMISSDKVIIEKYKPVGFTKTSELT